MKPLTIQPLSALAGAGVLALALLGTGVAAPQGGTQRMFIENVQDMNSFPNPRDFVVIRGIAPYTVPAGKLLVITGLGMQGVTGPTQSVGLEVDGQEELGATLSSAVPPSSSTVVPVAPPGYVLTAGQTAVLTGGSGTIQQRAWGYLVDA